MVEKALPAAVDYLFPAMKFISLNPVEQGVDMDSVRKSESALQNMVMNRMKLKRNSYATIKDCFKLGVG